MPIQVKEFAFVFHPITDVARSRKFYEGVLGLKSNVQVEFTPGKWWIEYDVAGQAIATSNAIPGEKSTSLTLEVADLDAAMATVKSSGTPIVHDIQEFPPCRMFSVKDPDGNEIGLHQRKAK